MPFPVDKDPTQRLRFYARLVNISSLARLKRSEKHALVEDYNDTFGVGIAVMWDSREWVIPSWGSEPLPVQWKLIDASQARIRGIVRDLMAGKALSMKKLRRHDDRVMRLKNGVLQRGAGGTFVNHDLVHDLLDLLERHDEPFPFKECPRMGCGTIFHPIRRQKYCSHDCTVAANEIGRKDSRRKYMRDYMQKRRAQEKPISFT